MIIKTPIHTSSSLKDVHLTMPTFIAIFGLSSVLHIYVVELQPYCLSLDLGRILSNFANTLVGVAWPDHASPDSIYPRYICN